ncbi:hypothetical protein [Burkholderia ubonensis]|uniref:hypothetical protein n=1 Tax=Burkholderia ubonensis TaxID=101571 RepID=UPI0018DF32DC|nr:hypothetical protein [Burkholderia ubonensis]
MKARYEAFLLRVAKAIVLGRNVQRAPVVSRVDNNAMFEMGYQLESIAKRIETGYENE